MSVPEAKYMWTDCCTYCFPRALQITQTPTFTSRGFPELSSFLLCQSPVEIYWQLFLLIRLLTAEPKALTVICFQIILFPDSPIRSWMFNKGLLHFCVMLEDMQVFQKWLEKVEACGQHNSSIQHQYEFSTWCIILYHTWGPQEQAELHPTLAATVQSLLQARTMQERKKREWKRASPHLSGMRELQWLLYIGNILHHVVRNKRFEIYRLIIF